jgi:hypothetical protein
MKYQTSTKKCTNTSFLTRVPNKYYKIYTQLKQILLNWYGANPIKTSWSICTHSVWKIRPFQSTGENSVKLLNGQAYNTSEETHTLKVL